MKSKARGDDPFPPNISGYQSAEGRFLLSGDLQITIWCDRKTT